MNDKELQGLRNIVEPSLDTPEQRRLYIAGLLFEGIAQSAIRPNGLVQPLHPAPSSRVADSDRSET